MKQLQRAEELRKLQAEQEQAEQERREALMKRLTESRNNNLKLFSLKTKKK